MRLQEKVAVITGSGRGIGRGMAQRFAQEGARVVIAERFSARGFWDDVVTDAVALPITSGEEPIGVLLARTLLGEQPAHLG